MINKYELKQFVYIQILMFDDLTLKLMDHQRPRMLYPGLIDSPSQVYHRKIKEQTLTFTPKYKSEQPINSMIMSLDCGRKLKHQEQTHAWRRRANSTQIYFWVLRNGTKRDWSVLCCQNLLHMSHRVCSQVFTAEVLCSVHPQKPHKPPLCCIKLWLCGLTKTLHMSIIYSAFTFPPKHIK